MAGVKDKLMMKKTKGGRDWNPSGSFINKPAKGWLHPDSQLDKDAGVCYGVRYIGCLEVKQSMKSLDFETRTAVAKESISRVSDAAGLKSSYKKTKRSAKIGKYLAESPNMTFAGSNVNLTITVESLHMIDMESGNVIGNHLMPGISFASGGDPETMDFVAYVAKDEIFGRACHVLECGSGLAQDVITTIGQAFELRFKQYLASRPETVNMPDRLENPLFGRNGDAWGNDEDKDYYNDRFGARPPSPSQYSTPPCNLPISDGIYNSVRDRAPTTYVQGAEGGMVDNDLYDNSEPRKQDQDIYDNRMKDPPQAIIYDNPKKVVPPDDSAQFDMIYDNRNNGAEQNGAAAAAASLNTTTDGAFAPVVNDVNDNLLVDLSEPPKSDIPKLSLDQNPPPPPRVDENLGTPSPSSSFAPTLPPRNLLAPSANDGDSLKSRNSVRSTGSTTTDAFDMTPFCESIRDPERNGLESTNSTPPEITPAPLPTNAGTLCQHEPWFHGKISRTQADKLLAGNGDFLIRESANSPGQFVLSGKHDGKVKHLLLIDPEGVVRTKDRTFESISHLVKYHMEGGRPITSNDSELVLRYPIINPEKLG